MSPSCRQLDLSPCSSQSDIPDMSVCLNDGYKIKALKMQSEINERIDFIAMNTTRAEIELLSMDIMAVLNEALQKIPLELFQNKLDLLKVVDYRKGTNSTSVTNATTLRTVSAESVSSPIPPSRSSIRQLMNGAMRNTAANDRSMSQNYSRVQFRENIMRPNREIVKNEDNHILFALLDQTHPGMGPRGVGGLGGSLGGAVGFDDSGVAIDGAKILGEPLKGSLIPVKPQPNPDAEQSNRTLLSLFAGNTGDSMYTRSLGFNDTDFQTKQIKLDYFAFKSSDLNFPMVTSICFIGIASFFSFTFRNIDHRREESYKSAAASTIILAAVCMLIIVMNRLTLLSFKYNIKSLQRFHKPMILLMKTRYGQLADDGVVLFCAITAALYLASAAMFDVPCNDALAGK